jgi:signal peptidase II
VKEVPPSSGEDLVPATRPASVAAKRGAILAVAALVVLVDQVTKTWAEDHLFKGNKQILPGLKLQLSFNPGIAFGFGRGVTPFLEVLVVLLVVTLLGLGRRASRTATLGSSVAMGLLLGGACGNLCDRILRHNGGAVIDFIHFRFWWIFNLADAAIVTGAIALVVTRSRRSRQP